MRAFVEADEFGFGEQRIGRGDRLGRVWRRIWHVWGGSDGRLSASLREFMADLLEISGLIPPALSPYGLRYV